MHQKGILLHGGPPSDFRLRLDEGEKDSLMHGASETYAATCHSTTTKVCRIYESQPNKVRYTVPQGVVSEGPRSKGRKGKKEQYKKHVHTPQRKIQLPLRPRKTLDSRCYAASAFIVGRDSFREQVEALVSYNLRNDGFQQDCIYTEQGHLITPTSFMTHSMAIDPHRSVVVSWMPIPLCIPQVASQHWCPPRLPSSTSQ